MRNDVDIYFTEEYSRIYEKNNEGKLVNYSMECEYGKVYYNFLLREINLLNDEIYYDIITPYGYGGPLFLDYEDKNLRKLILIFTEKFEKYCEEKNIVSEFIRFHPIIKNHIFMDEYMDIYHIRDTVYIDLTSETNIWNNIHSKCRNMIRKGEKNDIQIIGDNSKESLDNFIDIYQRTMEKNNAMDYYFFSKEFFYNTYNLLKNNLFIFNAVYENKVIGSSMIMKYGDFIHYHFSGLDKQYLKLASNNLLLYKVALWGHEQGCKYFHLGGGYSGKDDNLFKFKKSFSKNSIEKFYIGKKIHNMNAYDKLVNKWNELNIERKDENLEFFPLYRR